MRRAGVEHLAADELDVVVGATVVLARDEMRAEEGDVVGELGGEPAEALLGLDVEAVAGLDLLVGDPGGQRLCGRVRRQPEQFVVARGPGRGHRYGDPAGLVRRPGHPRGELVGAVAGEDEVGVAVDEARDHAAAAGVDGARRPAAPAGPTCGHEPVLDDERGVADEPERPLARAPGRS